MGEPWWRHGLGCASSVFIVEFFAFAKFLSIEGVGVGIDFYGIYIVNNCKIPHGDLSE